MWLSDGNSTAGLAFGPRTDGAGRAVKRKSSPIPEGLSRQRPRVIPGYIHFRRGDLVTADRERPAAYIRCALGDGSIGSPMRPPPGDGVKELADIGDKFGGGLEGGEVATYWVLLPADDGVGHLREAADGTVTLEVRDGGRHAGRRGLAAHDDPDSR